MVVEEFTEKCAVVHIQGRLDSTTANKLKSTLQAAAEKGLTHFVLNMDEVNFVDSSGLSAMVVSYKAVRNQQGELVLANVGQKLKIVLQLSRLDQVFMIYADVSTALASFSHQQEDNRLRQPSVIDKESSRRSKQHPLLHLVQKRTNA